MQVYDVVVIGAGPSGMVAAAYLKKMNVNVLVLEKETFLRIISNQTPNVLSLWTFAIPCL